jgi:hypothetical protein
LNNNLVETLAQHWNGSNWMNDSKYNYTYDTNNNRIEEFCQIWEVSTWVNLYKYSYTYDLNNNRIEWLEQNWDGSGWVNYYLRTYTYDGNNNMIYELLQSWNGSSWVDYVKFTFTYIVTEIEQFEEGVNTFSLSQNYPNPFNPSTKISWQIPVGGWQTLKIYDVLGIEVTTLVNEYKPAGSYEVEWEATGLASGVYFYQLKADDFVETKKMILMK